MKTTDLNVLIIDDINFVGESILNRLTEVNLKYHDDYVNIKSWYYKYNVSKSLVDSIAEIKTKIKDHDITYLLVDIGFNKIVDDSYKYNYPHLEIDTSIYSDIRRDKDRVTIDMVLKNFGNDHMINNLAGIIVYTYQPEFKQPEVIHQEFMEIMPKAFNKDILKVIETNSEIYRPADAQLHILTNIKEYPGIRYHGLIKDFKLYGLFMGEILYNQIRHHHFSSRIKSIESMKSSYLRYYIIAYFLFITINISSNILSEYLVGSYRMHWGVGLLVFGVLIPALIIWLKPEFFLISKNDDR